MKMNSNVIKVRAIFIIAFCFLSGVVAAQDNEVERIKFDSETGNFLDHWTVLEGQVQLLPPGYTLIGRETEATEACHALVDGIDYIWSEGPQVISPNGQQIEVTTDDLIKVDGDAYEIVNEYDDKALDISDCDSLAALLFPATGAGIFPILWGVAAIAILADDNDNRGEVVVDDVVDDVVDEVVDDVVDEVVDDVVDEVVDDGDDDGPPPASGVR